MLTYSIVINILLFIVCGIILYKWYTQRTYNKQLFTRSWQLEITLMNIYNDSTDEVKKTILNTLNSITPL
jgi:hypothetical protein